MSLTNHIGKIIKAHGLVGMDDSVLVAVSGGVDSMVLLHVLKCLNISLQVAHVNYHLRGEDSDLDEQLVTDYCKANSIECHKLDANLQDSSGIQEQARQLRYRWFDKLCQENDLQKIATAHHQGDQAETLLFNLSRGAGMAGASGMRLINGSLIRPLLNTSKAEIELHAALEGVRFRQDKSNFSIKYARNRIRNQIIPELSIVNQNVISHFSDFSKITRQADQLILDHAKKLWDSNSLESDSVLKLRLSNWGKLPYAELIVHYMLQIIGVEQNLTTEVFGLISSLPGRRVESNDYIIWKDREELVFEKRKRIGEEEFILKITDEGTYELLEGKLMVSKVPFPDSLVTNNETIHIDPKQIQWPLTVRVWKAGDSFQPFGMDGRQKVSDFLIQNKVSMTAKKKILVMQSEGEIIWIVGMRISDKLKIEGESRELLKMLITA